MVEEAFTTHHRQSLFLEMAGQKGGVSADIVHDRAAELGDEATPEAYYNLARRMTHRGLLRKRKEGRKTVYTLGVGEDEQWLDESVLARLAPSEYPLIGLTVMRTVSQQLRDVPEPTWLEIQHLLSKTNAREAFFEATISYLDDFRIAICEYLREESSGTTPKSRMISKGTLERDFTMLTQFLRFGLGLSREAVKLPPTYKAAIRMIRDAEDPELVKFWDENFLRDELSRRVANEPMIVEEDDPYDHHDYLLAGVDGSTRGGLLSLEGETGDLMLGSSPAVSINTSIAQINRHLEVGGRRRPVFLRLPEKPEDMQRDENRYTMMVKAFHPDLSDSEYFHAIWAAMDLLEVRAASKALKSWNTPGTDVEVRPADVVLRDGTIVPNDRDFNHYKQQNTAGQIVRRLVEGNWDVLKKTEFDKQVIAGVVKRAQLRVVAPVINWVIAQDGALNQSTSYAGWSLESMNYMDDQSLLTRILTAGRKDNDPWKRSCLVFRPFHATTNYAKGYSRTEGNRPADKILKRRIEALDSQSDEEELDFWQEFRTEGDPYLQMLGNAWYASTFLGCSSRVDGANRLPRLEFGIVHPTAEIGKLPTEKVAAQKQRLFAALQQDGFDVDQDHDMFESQPRLDILPRICIDAHSTVKIWAADILARVQEFAAYHLSQFHRIQGVRKARIGRWGRRQLEAWIDSMVEERNQQAGGTTPQDEEKPALSQSDESRS